MFKKVLVIFFLLLLFSGVFSIRLVDPISKTLVNDDYVGSVVRGSELELIFSKELGKFSTLQIVTDLPDKFNVRIEDYLESIKVFIKVPKDALKSQYDFEIKMLGRETKSIRLYFLVEDNLLDASINNHFGKNYVNSPVSYEIFLINNSYADVEFFIQSQLPFSWVNNSNNSNKSIIVPKKSIVKEELIIFPQFEGKRNFELEVLAIDFKKNFSVFVEAKPTIVGKNSVVFSGFPFYSISLAPSYFFNGLIAFFLK